MSFESNRILGGVGALLMVIGAVGLFTSAYLLFLLFVGAVLVLIALKGFADHYQDGGIFNDALYGFIAAVVGIVATVAVAIILLSPLIAELAGAELDVGNPAAMQQIIRQIVMEHLQQILGASLGAYLVFVISMILSAILIKKSLDALSARSGEKMFGTAGLVWLIGGVLTIILIGLIVIWISWILMAVAFFSIKTAQAPAQPAAFQLSPQPPPQ
ncbi:MAG: DUF996 domain-containing protein [Candidatus Bathyarchaeia archaeon]